MQTKILKALKEDLEYETIITSNKIIVRRRSDNKNVIVIRDENYINISFGPKELERFGNLI